MKPTQLKSLKVAAKVAFREPGKPEVAGEVVDVGYSAVRVKWADGQFSIFLFNDADDDRIQFVTKS